VSSLHHLRRFVYRQLHPEGWERRGLSPTNWFIINAIWLSILFGVMATEPTFATALGGGLLLIDYLILIIFATEYVGRLATVGLNPRYRGAGGLVRYALKPASVADLIVLAPLFLAPTSAWLLLFRLLRILRLLRLATMPNVQRAIAEFGEAFLAKRYELVFTVSLGLILILVSSTTLYLIERDIQPDVFGSIPRAIWWSVITFTTVGYGDSVPATSLGRFFAGFFAIAGLGLVAMLTGVIASSLSDAAQKHSENSDDD